MQIYTFMRQIIFIWQSKLWDAQSCFCSSTSRNQNTEDGLKTLWSIMGVVVFIGEQPALHQVRWKCSGARYWLKFHSGHVSSGVEGKSLPDLRDEHDAILNSWVRQHHLDKPNISFMSALPWQSDESQTTKIPRTWRQNVLVHKNLSRNENDKMQLSCLQASYLCFYIYAQMG